MLIDSEGKKTLECTVPESTCVCFPFCFVEKNAESRFRSSVRSHASGTPSTGFAAPSPIWGPRPTVCSALWDQLKFEALFLPFRSFQVQGRRENQHLRNN